MTFQENWSEYQKALYWDKEGNWERAHDIIQDISTKEASWIHAYLHRKEGDEWNANYWYTKAAKSFYRGTLESEWDELWEYFDITD